MRQRQRETESLIADSALGVFPSERTVHMQPWDSVWLANWQRGGRTAKRERVWWPTRGDSKEENTTIPMRLLHIEIALRSASQGVRRETIDIDV